ncbi:ATP-binding protein [Massilia sp. NP310]|uniref:AAA family ATPase n=2 Tax=Telluria group TaxID=2895353 RepID=UPI001C639D76|nr:ATP-binding protein [Massilia timonae]QYG03723.1 ATP-binding protein [Massilia sp. NP310]
MKSMEVNKVVFVGAESTGKSTLALHLASQSNAGFVPEIGRFIWEEKQGQLTADDYVEIAERHRDAEDEAVRQASGRWVFVDTNALTTLLLGLCFGQVTEPAPPALLRYADDCRTRYLHHFVCADDIPYEEEPGVRENAAWRTHIQTLVLEDLDRRGIAYTVLTGTLQARAVKVTEVLSRIEQERQLKRAAA